MTHRIHTLLTLLLLTLTGQFTQAADLLEPTFARDIAPIVYAKCTTCHRPNSSGPFSLITYSQVKRRAKTIAEVLDDNYMPPWKPVDHGITFANQRSMSSQQKATIQQWIKAGCPEGDAKQTPPPPTFPDGWSLGKPDLVVTMNGQFDVPADGPDIFRSFVFPVELPEDKWIKAVELRSTATSSVHHSLFFVDANRNGRKLDGADGKPGIHGMGFLAGSLNGRGGNKSVGMDAIGSLGGYVPGTPPNKLPGDLAMALPKGADIVMQTHFHPTGKPEVEKATLALYFADKAPSRQITPIMVPPLFGFGSKIKIPADARDYRIADLIKLPVATRAVGVGGHAHYVCREMIMTATLPEGETKVLLHIDDWDLGWQEMYMFAKPIDLPAGTVVRTEIAYDNSADNPENPHQPPKPIRWGRGSFDEMGSITLFTVARDKQDQKRLQAAIDSHFIEPFANASGKELTQMYMQLDDNHDRKLDHRELEIDSWPLARVPFAFADSNRNGGLEASELNRFMILRKVLPSRLTRGSSRTVFRQDALMWQFSDITGKTIRPFDDDTVKALALVFIATDCPIANSFQPELKRLQKTYSEQGVRFVMIHPYAETTADQARQHVADYSIAAPVVIDTNQSISRRVNATVTPQAFVFARGQSLPVYQGRIDDTYATYGRKRQKATSRDLANALKAVVHGRPIANAKTDAVGCIISYDK